MENDTALKKNEKVCMCWFGKIFIDVMLVEKWQQNAESREWHMSVFVYIWLYVHSGKDMFKK